MRQTTCHLRLNLTRTTMRICAFLNGAGVSENPLCVNKPLPKEGDVTNQKVKAMRTRTYQAVELFSLTALTTTMQAMSLSVTQTDRPCIQPAPRPARNARRRQLSRDARNHPQKRKWPERQKRAIGPRDLGWLVDAGTSNATSNPAGHRVWSIRFKTLAALNHHRCSALPAKMQRKAWQRTRLHVRRQSPRLDHANGHQRISLPSRRQTWLLLTSLHGQRATYVENLMRGPKSKLH